MENLATKVGEKTVVKNKKTQKFANHLAHKATALRTGEPARVLLLSVFFDKDSENAGV